jgi:sugar phosphate isomerase/epimerase
MKLSPTQTGYCTNVHAGADLAATRANLQRHALAVKERFSPAEPMGVGLWLSAQAAGKLRAEGQTEEFAGWLRDAGLVPFTFNGFPHGDFHQAVVKHRVYEPTWCEPARLEYTLDLIAIQDALLPPGMEGSISTLPLAWGQPPPRREQLELAAANLRRVAEHLARLEQGSGRLIYLCLEPEPGCVLQRGGDVVRFFQEFLLPGGDEDKVRRYLRVCHDVCHAAVMFEPQAEVLAAYQAAGIAVGKVQVSSAVRLPLDRIAGEERQSALAQLASFAEDRYLHQTVIRTGDAGVPAFHEDLPAALRTVADARRAEGEWRIHFHVPIYLERFGRLESTQNEIGACLEAVADDVRHFEVETYAWGVLPAELRQPDLASGIAREMTWFRETALENAGQRKSVPR